MVAVLKVQHEEQMQTLHMFFFSRGCEVVFFTSSCICKHCSLNLVSYKTCARHLQRVNLSNDLHTRGDDACFDWRVPFPS